MANGHGGYRKPSNPAPVSGPGAMSKRTDGGPVDGQPVQSVGGFEYGGRQEFEELQGAAPMAAAAPLPKATPIFAPTERPDEPITSGVPVGPGPGPAAPPTANAEWSRRLYNLAAADGSGQLGRIADILARRGL